MASLWKQFLKASFNAYAYLNLNKQENFNAKMKALKQVIKQVKIFNW